MQQLSTIQKREGLNDVFVADEKGNGGANHKYVIQYDLYPVGLPTETHKICEITFQNGGRYMEGSIHGVMDSDLLEIVRNRLQGFQSGQYSSRENAIALTHIEEALMWLNRRVEDRVERNVLGTMNK